MPTIVVHCTHNIIHFVLQYIYNKSPTIYKSHWALICGILIQINEITCGIIAFDQSPK